MSKFIFVTGGMVSNIGKGTLASSLARVLKNRGVRVNHLKICSYLNIDTGTMSPYQNGEVFVTEDGSESDIDIGTYERFVDENLGEENLLTGGKVYSSVINKERMGKYVGATVTVVPHITNEIKNDILKLDRDETDIVIVSLGDTVFNYENGIYLQAIRSLIMEVGKENVFLLHVGLIPQLESTGEIRVEVISNSVQQLNTFGLMPDAVVCRTIQSTQFNNDLKKRIARRSFLSDEKCVIHIPNMNTIYDIPLVIKQEGLDDLILQKFNMKFPEADLHAWQTMTENYKKDCTPIKFCIVGKYTKVRDAYVSIEEAIKHAAAYNQVSPVIELVDAEDVENYGAERFLKGAKAIIVPAGWGSRGINGMIEAIKFARLNKIPYLGIGFGLQLAAIEFGRNVLGIDANSTEIDPQTKYPVVDVLEEQKKLTLKGKTMRLGAYEVALDPSTMICKLYGQELITERHRNRYEFNNDYFERYEKAGMIFSGMNPSTKLVESVEIKDHPFFIATIYQPEFKSRPNKPHPLFLGLVNSAKSLR